MLDTPRGRRPPDTCAAGARTPSLPSPASQLLLLPHRSPGGRGVRYSPPDLGSDGMMAVISFTICSCAHRNVQAALFLLWLWSFR